MAEALQNRTKGLAILVLEMGKSIKKGITEDVLFRQILRSATSVGANYRSALRSRSMPDFINRITIAEEEADETCYWSEIMLEAGVGDADLIRTVYQEAYEITAMLTASGRTAKTNFQASKKPK